jgi:hypothetical protein
MSTHVHRIVYGGICEIWVESDGRTITKILATTADSSLVGKQLDGLPTPTYVESKLLAGETPAKGT